MEIGSRVHDNLIAGDGQWLITENAVLITGQNVVRGEVLGKIEVGAAPSAVADGGNTGDGVAGAVTLGSKTKVGIYRLECIEAASNAGRFMVTDPDGVRLQDLTVAVAYAGKHINLTIADGSADFIVGDLFTITTVAGSLKIKKLQSGSVDGSNRYFAVAAQSVDATSGDLPIVVYTAGMFSINKLVFDGSDVFADYEKEMRALSTYGKPVSDIAGKLQS